MIELKDKKGFLDTEVLYSIGFVILFGGALLATIGGYVMSKNLGWTPMPLWQIGLVIVAEFFATYFIVARG